MEIYIDNEAKLTLYVKKFSFDFFVIYLIMKGLRQHYVKLREDKKIPKLIDLLNKLEFDQVVIFVDSVSRCTVLCKFLNEQNFSAVAIHHGMPQEEWFVEFRKKKRIHLLNYFSLARSKEFKEFQTRVLVTTNSFERGMDIERVNIVFNYDRPVDANTYLHRVCEKDFSFFDFSY